MLNQHQIIEIMETDWINMFFFEKGFIIICDFADDRSLIRESQMLRIIQCQQKQ